jgi:hypothetical protein
MAHPGPFSFLRTTKPPPPIRPRRCVVCHQRPPSRTCSALVDSPPPFTPRNSLELNPHQCRPPASPVLPRLTIPDPIKGTQPQPPPPQPTLVVLISSPRLQVPPHRALRATAIHHRRQPSSVTPLPNATRGEDPFILLSLPMNLRQGFEPRSAGEPALR